ncbi:Down syndrome cell adhesion molecule homolog [Eumeta japonica]|uniref:Down syndrome cell adhesion molecule homolog n=1 Tax=Eumeta variegata TaxID=151549 RepID=A0A4C1SAQ6_EUMVA|nr:Down syndrome cell adhesion molecule homolog [Eumeta japonica]
MQPGHRRHYESNELSHILLGALSLSFMVSNSSNRLNRFGWCVSPKWVTEPKDEAVLAGEPLALHCHTTGSPTPQVTWMKQRGAASTDFVPLVNLGGRLHFSSNGTLWLEAASPYDEGQYMCRAENGVGAPLTKTIFVSVNEPARFELTSHNVSARRDAAATLVCDARGDHPLRVTWSHNHNHIDLNTYRLSISEVKTDSGLKSQLFVSRAGRPDSGVYKCQAVNAYGQSDHYIYLSVQEKPDSPHSLAVTEILNRAVRLSWSQGFDGNSPLVGYTVQYAVLSVQGAVRANQFDSAVSINVSVENGHLDPHCVLTRKGENHYEALLNNLKPHTAYMIRLAAYNQIDRSAYAEPVVVKTQEEAPSEPPTQVHVTPGGPGELHVSWRPPAREAWHGELLGYTVICTEISPSGTILPNSSRTLTVNGWSASELNLSGLRKFTRYEIQVRAFNGVGAGPASNPVSATTLEGVPESHPTRVTCSPLSSSSMKVSWSPPPVGQHGGLIQGYKVIYSPLTSDHADVGEIKRVTTTDTYLHTLHKYTNYSVQVLAFTNAGDGKRSPPVFCMTEEDLPSAPQNIKALAFSSDTVLVSWLPAAPQRRDNALHGVPQGGWPLRTSFRLGKHPSFPISADKIGDTELMFKVRHLMENQQYEFWVSATTGSGEGESTLVVGQGPSSRIPARVASFGGSVIRGTGQSVILPCTCVGNPPPRSRWTHASVPVTHHQYYQVTPRGHLHIREVNEESSGNFTCTATNNIGEDSITYHVVALRPPAAPALSLQYTTASSIKFHWQLARDGGSPILGYILHYKHASETEWHSIDLSPEASSYTMDVLKCGSTYNAKIQAKNKVSIGPPSEVLSATTRGGRPKPPKPEEHLYINSTAIKINFYAWRDGGCPILGFRVSYRRVGTEHWIKVGDNLSAASQVLGDLAPAAWYELTIEAYNDAGVERVNLYADTRNLDGGRIPPMKPFSPLSGGERKTSLRTVILSCVASGVVIVITLAAIVCVIQGKKKYKRNKALLFKMIEKCRSRVAGRRRPAANYWARSGPYIRAIANKKSFWNSKWLTEYCLSENYQDSLFTPLICPRNTTAIPLLVGGSNCFGWSSPQSLVCHHSHRSLVSETSPQISYFYISTQEAGKALVTLKLQVSMDEDNHVLYDGSQVRSPIEHSIGYVYVVFFCLSSGHYLRDDRKLSESNEAEREKLRDGQKLYSSSSINGNEKSNDDSSAELYEISPYATFGAPLSEAAHSLHLRTFGRRDDDAPPPHRHRRERRHARRPEHHLHAYRYDESSLSKSSTVEARHRARAACAAWREPRSDSDDNSDSQANTTTKGR